MLGSLAAGLLAISGPAHADIDDAYDHPQIERVAGSRIVYFNRIEYDRLSIPTGPHAGDGGFESSETLEGEVLKLSYLFENPDISPLQIKRNYLDALEARGFDILYADSHDALSSNAGRSFYRDSGIFSRSARNCCRLATRSSSRDLRYIAAQSADGSVLVGIAAFNERRDPGAAVEIAVVTSAEMGTEMDHQPLTVSEMETGLIEEGRVAVQDILFEFDSASILPESSDALGTVATLMSDASDLALLVVGHTDNSGSYDYNLSLSMARAQAVVDYLTGQHGIASDRLQAAGAGMMAPISTNRTDEGRALNRRVELVEMAR
ncbi:MAG: OmpA family protein [Rhodobacteraceae bacterium]|nr:MAG: OmpA family protein [Paracoccaceae bacterium]